ncbi:hypothetical protein MASR1M45_01350 [Candidatus Kapaibacterium sp.]
MKQESIIIIATAWGSKFGGINSFSIRLSKSLPHILKNTKVYCICFNGSEDDIKDALLNDVNLILLDGTSSINQNHIINAIEKALSTVEKPEFIWWLGHDIITGGIANTCSQKFGGKSARFMHMSYDDYAYIKHEPQESISISDKIDLQKNIFRSANKRFAVGPLLHKRMIELVGHSDACKMIIPGLSECVIEHKSIDRLRVITFGRFDASESLTKQGPLSVSSFANAVKIGTESYNKVIQESELKIIGVPNELAGDLRSSANNTAGRVVNLKVFSFIEDEERLFSHLQDSNLCLMLSWHEGFGLTAWEAISAGVPVLISKNSGVYKLLEEIGGAALGCINCVEVKGSDKQNFNDEDLKTVSNKIIEISSNLSMHVSNAQSLRALLRSYRYTWNHCAETIANELSLNISVSPVDSYTGFNLINSSEDILEGFEVSKANKLLDSARSYFNVGSYSQAQDALNELVKHEAVKRYYTIAMDSTLLECEISLRQNDYRRCRLLFSSVINMALDKQDWVRYVKAKSIENVMYRDQGRYKEAIDIGKKLVDISIEHKLEKSIIESCHRKLARSLALGGDWRIALEHGLIAAKIAEDRGFLGG